MTSHSFLSIGNQFLTEPAWGQTQHWSDQCPFCWPKPGSTRNEMSVWVDHGDKPQRCRRVVQHTGREGRKCKNKKLTLLPGALETQSSFPCMISFDGLWLCFRWRSWTSRWWPALNNSSATRRRSLNWDAPWMLWRLNCTPSTAWYLKHWPDPAQQWWQ